MSGLDARDTAGLGFDHHAEGIVTKRSVLLQMKADAG